ncbi:MAG: hypothetical protein NTW68_08460 [candidate division NC10 bacterium]|nr:hypothetical protein [candidate division NC10 bacterium]
MDRRPVLCHAPSFHFFWTTILLLGLAPLAYGFDEQITHPQLTRAAIAQSKLEATLKSALGISNGPAETLPSFQGAPLNRLQALPISEWLTAGSSDEDDPVCSAINHFHNPLKPFTQSGNSDVAGVVGKLWCWGTSPYQQVYSNVTWGTGYTDVTTHATNAQKTGNTADWDAARLAYYEAQRQENRDARNAYLAQTFYILGHLLHLVQDLGVPAHARDDFLSHFYHLDINLNQPVTKWVGNGFELFVKNHGTIISGLPT